MEGRILIIGAGPAGLAVAGRLCKAGLSFEILEKSDQIASSWHGHYDRLHLHTVKELSHLPHLPFPDGYPQYVPRDLLIEYYEYYAQTFNILPYFCHAVTSIKKERERWVINCDNGKEFQASHVVLATGVNHFPNQPHWPNEEDFHGTIIHSRHYKNVDSYRGKKVLVIGMGNTGAEIALDLAENDINTTISVRSPVSVVPRDVFGRPVQLTAKKLEKLPFGLGDRIGTLVRKVVIGDLSKYGLPLSPVHPAEQLRKTGKTPVIDLGTVEMIKSGKIKVVGEIERFESKGVRLTSGEALQMDAVILATGYKANLSEIIEDIAPELDRFQVPKRPVASTPAMKGLYFVGFNNYKVGGILGTIYHDSKTVAEEIRYLEARMEMSDSEV